LTVQDEKPLSTFAFEFSLRRYTEGFPPDARLGVALTYTHEAFDLFAAVGWCRFNIHVESA